MNDLSTKQLTDLNSRIDLLRSELDVYKTTTDTLKKDILPVIGMVTDFLAYAFNRSEIMIYMIQNWDTDNFINCIKENKEDWFSYKQFYRPILTLLGYGSDEKVLRVFELFKGQSHYYTGSKHEELRHLDVLTPDFLKLWEKYTEGMGDPENLLKRVKYFYDLLVTRSFLENVNK